MKIINTFFDASTAAVETRENLAMNTRNYYRTIERKPRPTIAIILFAIAVLGFIPISVDAQERNTDKGPDQVLRSNARVNPSTLAMELSVPIFGFPGRAGNSISNTLNYSSKVWQYREHGPIVNPSGSEGIAVRPWFARRTAAGWTSTLAPPRVEIIPDKFPYYMDSGCGYDGEIWSNIEYPEGCNFSIYYMKRVNVTMPDGSSREFRASDTPVACGTKGNPCNNPDMTGTYLSVDGTRTRLEVTSNGSTMFLPNGDRVIFGTGVYATSIIDAHGNVLSYNETNKEWTDTMGRVLPNPLPSNLNFTQDQTVGDQIIELPGLGSENLETTLSWRYLKHPSSSDPNDSGLGDLEQDLAYPTDFYCVGSTWDEISGNTLFDNTAAATVRLCTYGTSFPGTTFNPVVLTKITLANGQSYRFEYNLFGEIEKIIYPTGAYERFVYDEVHAVQAPLGPYDQANRGVVDRYVSEKGDGSDEQHWEYGITRGYSVSPAPFIVTTTNPDGTSTQQYLFDEDDPTEERPYGFDIATTGRPYDERVYSSDTTPVLLSRKLTVYDTTGPLSGGFSGATRNLRPTTEIWITFEPGDSNALATMTETVYDTTGNSDPAYFSSLNAKQIKKYHYVVVNASTAASASPTTAAGWFSSGDLATVAETDFIYDSNYKARNIVGLATETRVKDAAGNVKAKTQFTYDETAYDLSSSGTMPTPASGSWVDPTGSGEFGSTIGNKRGRVTTVKSYYDISNSYYIETHSFYDQYGNLRKARDGRGNDTESQYDDDYAFAYPTKVLTPIPDSAGTYGHNNELETTTSYDYDTGLQLTVTDPNGAVTEMEYDDPLYRPTKVIAPNDAETVTEYGAGTSAATRWVKVTSDIDDTNTKYSITWFDGLGRTWLSQSEDAQGDVFSVTCYDNMGRVSKTSNPFRYVSNPTCSSSLEWTTPAYDDLGRRVTVTTPDSAVVQTAYSLATSGSQIGAVVTVEDQAGKLRRSIANALGQLTRVDEPNSSNALGSVSSPSQATYYHYNTLGKMVRVQQGDQNRYFMYDSLGRMLRVKQPEQTVNTGLNTSGNPDNNSWTAEFSYDNNGNVLTATDAKGTTITNTYDAMNRVVQRSYSDSPQTPTVNFYYDGTGLPSVPAYSKGKLTKVSNSVSESRYTEFDVVGRLLDYKQITDGQTYTSEYEYNLSGALVKETYPSGRVVENTFDDDGQIESIFGKANASATERTYANAFSYTPDGRIEKLRLGNFLWEAAKLNNRLQVTEFSLGHGVSSGDVWKNSYEYGELQTNGTVDATKNTGNIGKQTVMFAGLANPFVQTYKYDPLYRLTEAKETSNGNQTWKQVFDYDRYGNRTTYDKWIGTTEQTLTAVEEPAISNTTNRITSSGYTFDANGNLIVDAEGRQFTFNGDNKQTQVLDDEDNLIGQYFYDGEGKRIKKVVGDDTTVFVYSGSKLIAEYSTETPASNPTTSWTVTDQLGSPRVIVNALGAVVSRRDFLPFGEELGADGTYRTTGQKYGQTDSVRQKFTGYQRDNETGLDFAEARMYQNLHGRFTAIDPLLASGKSANPQTFNRYVYVMNSPLALSDPEGLQSGTPTEQTKPKPKVMLPPQIWYDAPYERSVMGTPDGPSLVDTVTKTLTSAIVTFAENNGSELLFGQTEVEHTAAGRMIGDTASIIQGVAETNLGIGMAAGGGAGTVTTSPACLTGAGCAIPATTLTVTATGAAVATHGTAVIGNTIYNMANRSDSDGGNSAKDYNPAGRSKIQTAEDAADQAKDLREAKKNADKGKGDKIIDSTRKSDDREIQKAIEEWRENKNKP